MSQEVISGSRRKFLFLALLLTVALAVSLLFSLSVGTSLVSPKEVLTCLIASECGKSVKLVVDMRFVRACVAALSGAMLALAGTLVQGLTRNPLADPYIIGVSSTSLAVVSAAVLLSPSVLVHRQVLIAVAFAGALLGYILTTTISLLSGGSGTSLVLSGIAVSALFSGISHVLLYLSQNEIAQLGRNYVFLLLGSTSGVLRQDITYLAISLATSLAIIFVLGIPKALNAYLFGELYASQLGYRVRALTATTALVSSVLTGATVAVVGVVGFIGLAGPHIARISAGTSDHRATVVLSALTGSILTVLADALTRAISAISSWGELPLGVVTGIIGAPFLAYLVVRGGRG
jgi:iron complex transport system permease protein